MLHLRKWKEMGLSRNLCWIKKPGDEVVVKQGESSAGSKRLGGLVKVQYIREHGKNEGLCFKKVHLLLPLACQDSAWCPLGRGRARWELAVLPSHWSEENMMDECSKTFYLCFHSALILLPWSCQEYITIHHGGPGGSTLINIPTSNIQTLFKMKP